MKVLAVGVVLSAVVLCLVRAWTVFDLTELPVRQTAILVSNGEMERLRTISAYPAVAGIPNSRTRLIYGSATNSAQSSITASVGTFTASATADSTVLISGSGASTSNFVWIDRPCKIVGPLSWVAYPAANFATNGATTAASCWYGSPLRAGKSCLAHSGIAASGLNNSGGDTCSLLTVLLDYSYPAFGSAPVAEATLRAVVSPARS